MFVPGLGLTAFRPPTAFGLAATVPIFTITGKIHIIHIAGHVTGAMDATVCNLSLQHSNGPTALCGVVAIASDIVNTYYTITGVFANAMIPLDATTVAAAAAALMAAVSAGAGTIDYINSGNQTGIVEWWLTYIPIYPGSSVVPT